MCPPLGTIQSGDFRSGLIHLDGDVTGKNSSRSPWTIILRAEMVDRYGAVKFMSS